MRCFYLLLCAAALGAPRPARAQLRFAPAVSYPLNADAYRVLAYDLNRDGRADLVVAGGGANRAALLLSTATGGFAPALYYPTERFCGGVGLGNADCDAFPDLWVSDFAGAVLVLPGRAGGAFGPAGARVATERPWHVAVGDFNHDDRTDWAALDKLTATLDVRLAAPGACAPAYGPGAACPTASGFLSADVTQVADLDGDGNPDLVVMNQASPDQHGLSVLLGTATGAFAPTTTYATGGMPADVALADVTGDASPDAVVALAGARAVAVLPGQAAGPRFGAAVAYAVPGAPVAVAVADFNRDARPDVAAVLDSGRVVVLLGQANGTLAGPVPVARLDAGGGAVRLVAADFNGDGPLDLALVVSGSVQVLLNTFAPLATRPVDALPAAVHPNPAVGGTFRLGNDRRATDVHVTDLAGRAVAYAQAGEVLTLPGAPAGVVLVEWRGGDGQARRAKVVVP